MEFLEQLQYESRPYAYALIAAIALYNANGSKVLAIAGLVMAFCSYTVYNMRQQSRARQQNSGFRPR